MHKQQQAAAAIPAAGFLHTVSTKARVQTGGRTYVGLHVCMKGIHAVARVCPNLQTATGGRVWVWVGGSLIGVRLGFVRGPGKCQ